MRGAAAVTGLLILGTFVIPGAYDTNRQLVSSPVSSPGPPFQNSTEQGSATLEGRVFGREGAPIAGATVSLAGSGFWPARSVRSGADGRFIWTEIPSGIYELRVSKGRLAAPPVEGLILDPGSRRAFGVALLPGWTLSGEVRDARTGVALQHAEVTVARNAIGLHIRRARTDARGRFALEGMVGDEQSLYVEAEGYVTRGPIEQSVSSPPITVRLQPAARVEGQVVDARGRPIAGASVRAFGKRAPPPGSPRHSLGVTIGPVPPISAAAGPSSLSFLAQTTSGEDGLFELRSLPPGPYTVAATHEDFAPAASDPFRLGPGVDRSSVRIVMRQGAELAGHVVDERGRGLEAIPVELRARDDSLPRVSVTGADGSFSFRTVRGEVSVTALPYDLPPARTTVHIEDEGLVTIELSLPTSLYTLRGRVVDERGFGVGGALLTVTASDPAIPLRRTVKSDPDGTFSVPALPAPPFSLGVEHPAFSPAKLSEVDRTDDLEVVLYAGVTLLGQVRDDWTDDELRGARVQLRGPFDGDAMTRNDGTFVFRQLPTGTYDVTLSHPDYETQTRRIVIEPPQYVDRPQELETVRLEPGGIVEGAVVDANREPVAAAEVAWGDPPRWERGALTGARGRFRLRGVPAGPVWITARHDMAGEASIDRPIVVRPLETSPGAFVELPEPSTE